MFTMVRVEHHHQLGSGDQQEQEARVALSTGAVRRAFARQRTCLLSACHENSIQVYESASHSGSFTAIPRSISYARVSYCGKVTHSC